MVSLIAAFFVSAAVTAACGLFMIPMLRKLKFGQSILEVGPKWHMNKQGTPTMGGFLFIVGISAAVLIAGWGAMAEGNFSHLFILAFAVIYGFIGFIDDYAKVKKKQNMGLSALQKLLLQLVVAAAFLALLRYFGYMSPDIYIPFIGIKLTLPWVVYLGAGILFVAGVVNAVNLTDGVDGLCSGVTLPIAVMFALLGYTWSAHGVGMSGVGVYGAALAGGLIGFLLYNFHPARVFMGDTGSLFLGGSLCGLAFVSNTPLIIVIAGLVYLLEMLSVILQVIYFKLTHGKRIFKMTPIHHHFEMSGWSEVKIFAVFTAVTALLCATAWLGVSARFPV